MSEVSVSSDWVLKGRGFPATLGWAAQTEATAHVKMWIIAADPKAQVGIQSVGAVS